MEDHQLKKTDKPTELTRAVHALVDKKLNVIRDHLIKIESNEELVRGA